MSGGAWNYQRWRIEEKTQTMVTELAELLKVVAETEQIVDWAESCDTSREVAEKQLYDLWVGAFNRIYAEER